MALSSVIALLLRFLTELDCFAEQLRHSGWIQTYNVRKILSPIYSLPFLAITNPPCSAISLRYLSYLFAISSVKLGRFWWNLMYRLPNKFASKWYKRFPPHLNNVSTLLCATRNAHRSRVCYQRNSRIYPTATVTSKFARFEFSWLQWRTIAREDEQNTCHWPGQTETAATIESENRAGQLGRKRCIEFATYFLMFVSVNLCGLIWLSIQKSCCIRIGPRNDYEHIYSPIRQTQTEKCRYIERNTTLDITKHIVIKMAQKITNSFMQWNKNSHQALITVNNHKWPENILQ